MNPRHLLLPAAALLLTAPPLLAQANPGLSTKPSSLGQREAAAPAAEKRTDEAGEVNREHSLTTVRDESVKIYLQAAQDGQAWAMTRLGALY